MMCTQILRTDDERAQAVAPIASEVLVSRHVAPGELQTPYFMARSAGARRGGPVLVSVHGISRNAQAHASLLAPLAARHGAVVVAPLFDSVTFPDYQRIGRRGRRADRALERVLDDAKRRTGASVEQVHLFGYSGGAQFAHRFAMLYPERVLSLGLGAAGWYSFPDKQRRFPFGVKPTPYLGYAEIAIERFLDLKIRVFVGDLDCERDSNLNRNARIDTQQGANRFQRAAGWVGSLRRAGLALGKSVDVGLDVLPGARHDFEQNVAEAGLDELIFSRLF